MTHEELIKLDMPHLRDLASRHGDIGEKYADDRLCDFAFSAMMRKLEKSRDKGRGGWWDKDRCAIEDLKLMLNDHVQKGDMVDVMNLAAMIYVRESADT